MRLTLHSWHVNRHQNGMAHVSIRGWGWAGFLIRRKNWVSEGYNIPLNPNPKKNGNKAMVERAMKMSQNSWHIPMGMHF